MSPTSEVYSRLMYAAELIRRHEIPDADIVTVDVDGYGQISVQLDPNALRAVMVKNRNHIERTHSQVTDRAYHEWFLLDGVRWCSVVLVGEATI